MIVLRLLFQTVVLALSQIWANKFRALLTTLGVIIGVASIIAVVACLAGMEKFVLNQFERFGTRKIYLDGQLPREMENKVSWRDVQLKIEEINAIADRCPSISAVCPFWFSAYSLESPAEKLESVSVPGIWNTWHEIEGRQVIMGRPFSSIDEQERRQVCLINEKAIEELGLDDDPVGEYLLISGRRFLIVGVVETIQLSAMFGGGDRNTECFIPFSTARYIMHPDGWINMCLAQLKSPEQAADAQAEITFMLRSMRRLTPDDPNTFVIGIVQQVIEGFRSVSLVISIVFAVVVGISLLVGGIGIMNIMLVSVSERTREIGLRKAVGAKPVIILLQFLTEATVLCMVGAIMGVLLGLGAVLIARLAAGEYLAGAAPPLWAVLLSVGFSMFIGVVFGMFPAIKAARLDPIVALRHE